jgi:hypothetical protein
MIITKVKVREWFIFTEQKSLSGLDIGFFYFNHPKTLNFKWSVHPPTRKCPKLLALALS